MDINRHKDYEAEKERLEYTKDYLNITIKAIEEYKSNSFQSYMENMSEEDKTDNSSAYINMMLKSQTMDFAEKNYYSYKKALKKPYFARIDFTLETEKRLQKLYIGKTSLMKAENNEMIIVDWRAPVASIYYDGKLGEVEYESEEGIEKGILSLKRQLSVEDGELKKVLDIDITANDEFLQESLSASAESRLKDIASTIQSEQNKIIRAPLNKPIIIQGVAGSGKTTIALHRIAYFMYTYEKTFNPENFLILAPNSLFIKYISDVLPELGVENVRQDTYVDFMKSLLGSKPKIIDKDDSISEIIEGKSESIENIMWFSKFKGSIEYMNMIDAYIKDIEKSFLPNKDFIVRGKTLMKKEDIEDMFLNDLSIYPFGRRIKEIEKSLKNKLSLVDKELIKKVENSYNMAIDLERKSKRESEEKRRRLVSLMDKRESEILEAEKEVKTAVKNYLKEFNVKSVNEYYKDFLNIDNMKKCGVKYLNNNDIKKLSKYTLENFTDKKVMLEDLAPLVYLKYKVLGFDKKVNVKSVVIDEAQDFSIFEFCTLKTCLETSMFTLLGDMSQGIYSHRSFGNWDEVMSKVFYKDKASYMTLEQSYRTTIEVMELGNKVIGHLKDKDTVLAKPVIRHGEEPECREFNDKNVLIKYLEEKVLQRISEDYKSMAIICKTIKECKGVKKMLDKLGNIETVVLSDKNKDYEAGAVIVPSHLAKGLEFDNVFIININEEYNQNALDIKLLYVGITRTLHNLHIYSLEGKNNLIDCKKFST